jgi:cytidylate kinase
MKIDLSKYLQERYHETLAASHFPGPVITISRQSGCPAKKVAVLLVEKLNSSHIKFDKSFPWRWISKEIMEESAKELGMDLSEIQYVFDYKTHGVLEDFMLSYTKKFYNSDRKIRNTIARVIRNFAEEGNAVIVGRGGVAITRDIPKSFHIDLEAPLEWRALRTSEKHNLSVEDARKYCLDIDKKRTQFREYYQGKGSDYNNADITINCMTLSIDEIVDIVISALKIRKII